MNAPTKTVLVVDHCPTCHQPHTHSADPGLGPYRVAVCRQPYLLDTP